ncbi:MAG TPA: hypothetical protein VFR21_06005 [Bradyrhizobium sp.]|nr:hypothetical protein [Bradyrhizobium sp.]
MSETAPARLSFYWSYVVRSRGRWQEDDNARNALLAEALRRFGELGLGESQLQAIAAAGIVEVSIPYDDEGTGWAPRILPWEFLLSEATRRFRERPLVVVRHLQTGRPRAADRECKKALFVENGAGPIKEWFTFEEERRWMQSQLGPKVVSSTILNPTATQLTAEIGKEQPDIIHLSGVDLHQGVQLGLINHADAGVDGLLMAGSGGELASVPHQQLAESLNPAVYRGARLAVFNFYRSAGRTSATTVQRGADAAIGFQDQIDDGVAERFLAAFYREWRSEGWDLLAGFRKAFDSVDESPAVRGTGIVLWSADSLVGRQADTIREKPAKSAAKIARAPQAELEDMLDVRVQPPESINYSLVHSGERLFKTFTLYRKAPGPLPPIQVKVVLQAGNDAFPFQTTVRMAETDHDLPLADRIHLPLTSRALRALRETVRTGLQYQVTCGGKEIACDTAEVRLSPIDEWRWDTVDDSRWLGAFVLPRDPAVLAIVDVAQKYLQALKDDSGAGFDGYQSVDSELEDPDAGVEMQVRALWCALAFEMNLAYVNPPPTFEKQSQRLRSPSDIVSGKRGTCIDLALMLAACLEYVDIYPVVFVLKDHAFPGFWRSEGAYGHFIGMTAGDEDPEENRIDRTTATEFTTYDDVLRHVRSGNLVPIETVMLTRRLSFHEAIEQGMENLKDRQNFGALLDVRRQRQKISPLPILSGE